MTIPVVAIENVASVNVRKACLEDYRQVAELEARYGLEPKSCEEWSHLWLNNPIYWQLAKSWPIGWVLEDSNRRIVGYIGNIPLSYQFEGKELLVASGRAWVVDSQYRSYSLLLMDYFLGQTNVDLYLNTSLSSQAFEGFRVFGPLPVPVGEWDRCRFWITNPVGFLASVLAAKGIPFAKLVSLPLSVPLLIKNQFSRGHFGKNGRPIDVQSCSGFDERFDTFWEELKQRNSRVLLGTRTREILEWHFRYALTRNKVWILCVNDGSRLIAYSIFCRQDNVNLGLKRVRLIDFQTIADDSWLLLPMLSRALERCRRSGIQTLEIIGLCPQKTEVIENLTPYQRKLASWRSFYKTNNDQLAERLNDPSVWDLAFFDGDSSL